MENLIIEIYVANGLGIPESSIFFTEGAFKWQFIKIMNIDIHFDDCPEECELIAMNTNCIPMLLWDEYSKSSVKSDSFGSGIY